MNAGRTRLFALATVTVLVIGACGKAKPTTSATTVAGSNSTAAAAGAASTAAPGGGASPGAPAGVLAGADTVLTKAPTREADSAVWAVYRETSTLDPLFGFDYPDNTALAVACESLLRQTPDLKVVPGLATSVAYKTDTSLVVDLRSDVKFWDGSPLTPADVVFSLKRQQDPKNAGFYSAILASATDIAASGEHQVTITTTARDMLLVSELAGPTGVVIQEKMATAQGADYGTPKGSIMCTGPYQLTSWVVGEGLTFDRFDGYWDTSLPRKLKKITIKGVADEAVLTSGLLSGEIDGTYGLGLATLDQLRASDKVTVALGQSYSISAFVVSSFSGSLGDVKVRQALSLAIDRGGIVNALYKGAAYPARSLGVPGQWGYANDTFVTGWNALPDTAVVNLEKAKQLVKEAGAEGKTVRLGMSSELGAVATQANEVKRAIESIGMKAEFVSVSAANYINFFIDPKAREGVDGFFTVNYSNTADPLSLFVTLIGPNGSQAYNGYADAKAVELLASARREADDTKRAGLVVELQKMITDQVLWVPLVAPVTQLIMSKNVTGAPATFQYMFGPWAAYIGKP